MVDIAVQVLMGLMLVCLGGMLESRISARISARMDDKHRREEAKRREESVELSKRIHEHIGFIRGWQSRNS